MHRTPKQLKKIKLKRRRPVAPPTIRGGDKRKAAAKKVCREPLVSILPIYDTEIGDHLYHHDD